MKVLVTGGAGFLGSHVVDIYLEHGHDVVVIDNLSTGSIANLNPKAIFYKMDTNSTDLNQVFRIEKPDVVNHHAAYTNGQDSVQNSRLFTDVNVLGSINLIEQSILHGVKRFIFASSGLLLYGEPLSFPCDEEHLISPTCQYAAGKQAVEQFLQKKHDQLGLEFIVFRYANAYGPRQSPQSLHGFIANYITNMLVGNIISVEGEGDQQRDFIYGDDCAFANLLALKTSKSGIYNIGSGIGSTTNTVLTILKTLTHYEFVPMRTKAIKPETTAKILDTRKIKNDLGWKPRTDIFQGLEKTVNYYRQYCKVV
jgi:UDP-glucose 4-epimerase